MKDLMFIRDHVRACLESDARCRNDDKWLIIQVLRRMGFRLYIPYESLKDIPSFEGITRCRRKLQEDGEYTADEGVIVLRQRNQARMETINEWW